MLLKYTSLIQDCKPDIVAATAACEEVKKSKKFAKILELILLIGNIMNSGTKNAQSVGFDISYLPKVSLLHYYRRLVHTSKCGRLHFDAPNVNICITSNTCRYKSFCLKLLDSTS